MSSGDVEKTFYFNFLTSTFFFFKEPPSILYREYVHIEGFDQMKSKHAINQFH